MQFSELGLAEPLLRATQQVGYQVATPIQAAAIPVILAGRDLIGCAQTGTGKTAAFTLPMLDRLMQTSPSKANPKETGRPRRPDGAPPKPRTLRALVLSPTRELASQINDSLASYGQFTPLRQTAIFGGVSQVHQLKALRHGVDILVATPGRLLDLMQQGHIDLARIELLVLDEADRMLDMGFLPDLKRILAKVPPRRQTLMFSATMPVAIRHLAQQWLTDPAFVEIAPVGTTAERIDQSVHLVDKRQKADLLVWLLNNVPRTRTLVFSRTKHGADKIVKRLRKEGVHSAALHSNKSQAARLRTLEQFKSQNPPVLVATDIAARGLDVDNVSHVVNFDLPDVPETYVHRIGRTARAGATGAAVSFCSGDERGLLRQIEKLIQRALAVEPAIHGFTQPEMPKTDATPSKNRRRTDRPLPPKPARRKPQTQRALGR
jgi:ATP-dependent RNA helicase RhlE